MAITDAMLGTGAMGEPTRDVIIDYINGLDLDDRDKDGSTTDARNQMGDPMNAQPVSVVYGPAVTNARVYFATNDGYLHSINTETGVEAWAFVPPEFMGDQLDLYQNNSVATKHYGLDGNMRVQTIDNNGDGTLNHLAGDKVYLFFGMRRGGDTYYALDVSNPDAPSVMWRKDSASLPGIGQTWATPVPTKININGVVKDVLVIGGGYDPTQDDLPASTDTLGNSIYIVDIADGSLLWRASKTGATKNFSTGAGNNASMDYAIPADVKVLDLNGDKLADRMYFGDMGGQVWRLDIWNGQPAVNLVTGGVIAQLGAAPSATPTLADTRRFYYSPDVALVSNHEFHFVHVGIGSGHRAHPNSTANQDRFYALRDYNAFNRLTQVQYNALTPIRDGNLVDITSNTAATVPQGSPGWKFQLSIGGWRGEKVLAEARTFDDKVYFNTYTPNVGTGSSCTPSLGLRRQYAVSVFNGGLLTNQVTRFSESDGAPLAGPQFIFVEDTNSNDTSNDGQPEDDNNDGVIDSRDGDCVGETCVIRNDGLITDTEDLNTNPIRTFWTQQSVD
jgi:type IV pilus assembly protein PilY1